MVKGVLFDLDGVIVTTDLYHYKAWKKIADQEGIYFDFEINKYLRGVSRMGCLEILLKKASRVYSEEEKVALATEKNEYYKQLIKGIKSEDILPGAKEIVDELKKNNIKVAIGSSSKNATTILERIGLINEFDAIVQGTDIINSKPHPEVFLKAAELLGINPTECIVVEDSEAGIESANKGNMKSIYIGKENSNIQCDITIASLKDISVDRIIAL